jgi:hypothetical protein
LWCAAGCTDPAGIDIDNDGPGYPGVNPSMDRLTPRRI